MSRLLSEEMQRAFMNGVLSPILKAVQHDRDLILEFRGADHASVYCKGQCIDIVRHGCQYAVEAHEKFLDLRRLLSSSEEAGAFVHDDLPDVKQRIAMHRSGGMEIEFEQALIRA